MFIIWGRKRRRRLDGYCLDFCETCRAPEVHRVSDIYSVRHVYYIPLGSGSFAGAEIVCETCQFVRVTERQVTRPLSASRSDRAGMLDAIPVDIQKRWATILDREEEIRRHPTSLAPEQRVRRMFDIFQGFESVAQQGIGGDVKVHPRMLLMVVLWLAICLPSWWILPTIMSLAPLLWLFSGTGEGPDDVAIIVGLVVALVATIGLVIYYFKTRVPYYLKHHVEKPLAVALASMKPTNQEIEAVAAKLKQANFITGRVNQARLQELLDRAQQD